MKVKELNDILVYCKVNNLYEIEYVSAIGEIEPNLQESMQLYCHRLKMFVSVKDIITKAEKHGYNIK
mgnify:FL=1|jgi:hypothetical protein|tara:strand:+ start:255 stop:455 length:201 start_codon:yes stop_codon:yes gene_type:complete